MVVFGLTNQRASAEDLTLTTGLLAMAVFASFLGAFGLAAVGAEKDPTANLPPTVVFLAIPVGLAFIGTLGAFEVLVAIFVPQSTFLFILITGAGGAAAVSFSAFVVGDSWGMNPTTMASRSAFDAWQRNQWIQTASEAQRQSNIILMAGIVPILISGCLRVANMRFEMGLHGINAIITVGVILTLLGTAMALYRARHPQGGNVLAVAEVDIDAVVVLCKAEHLHSTTDRHTELRDPSGQDPLDVVLPQTERVWAAGREVAHVKHRGSEECRLDGLALGEEPVGDAALVEDLDSNMKRMVKELLSFAARLTHQVLLALASVGLLNVQM